MLHKLKRLFSRRPQTIEELLPYPDGKRYYREQHELRRESIDPDALKVINRLNRNGYRSYLVGGSVRDLLLGRKPKDFDIVTSATPTQIRNLFSNSRAIGRRFKIVHVIFHKKIIEVSTFRSLPAHRLTGKLEKDEDLIMKRDNQYGSPREDAARRDFTVNALYFDPRNESIIDFVGGYDDIMNRRISIIGDPGISFREDPVRMLRAAKFAALLEFQMDGACMKGIRKNRAEIAKASPSRMLEEYNKIFRTARTAEVFNSFASCGLLEALFPRPWSEREAESKAAPFEETSMGRRLYVADRMLSEREDLTINIIFALIFADLIKDILNGRVTKNVVEYIRSRLEPICKEMNIPGRDRDRLIQVFAAQSRFSNTTGRRRNKPEFFRNKIFFYEAFMVYKIIAISNKDEEAQQKAMFWEIGLRARPPENGKVISTFPPNRKRPGGQRGGSGGGRKAGSSGKSSSSKSSSGKGASRKGGGAASSGGQENREGGKPARKRGKNRNRKTTQEGRKK